jgi:hypothetical protein
MAANTYGILYTFKTQLLNGWHAFGTSVVRGATTADTFKLALYQTAQSLAPATTTAYTSTGELAATGNYTAGGVAVTQANPAISGSTACWTPGASAVWSNLTSSASFDTALLYNSTQSGTPGVALYSLGTQSITAGTLTLTMPANTAGNALVQIA